MGGEASNDAQARTFSVDTSAGDCIGCYDPSNGVHVLSERLTAEGRLSTLMWARKTLAIHWDESTCANGARGGHLELLKWVRAQGCPWDASTCSQAARGGHLELLQWARAQGRPWDERTCWQAARGGHLELLQWARSQGCPWDSESVCSQAARGGHLHLLRWARANGCPWTECGAVIAAAHGRLGVLQWARANERLWWNERACAMAGAYGHLEVLQWATLSGGPLLDRSSRAYKEMYNVALYRGHRQVVDWLNANDSEPQPPSYNRDWAEQAHHNFEKLLKTIGCIPPPWVVAMVKEAQAIALSRERDYSSSHRSGPGSFTAWLDSRYGPESELTVVTSEAGTTSLDL